MGAREESADARLVRLESRVLALEAALAARSRELRLILRNCCSRDVNLIARIRAGLPPPGRHAYDLELWHETTELTPVEVQPVLEDLWFSLTPLELADDES